MVGLLAQSRPGNSDSNLLVFVTFASLAPARWESAQPSAQELSRRKPATDAGSAGLQQTRTPFVLSGSFLANLFTMNTASALLQSHVSSENIIFFAVTLSLVRLAAYRARPWCSKTTLRALL